MDYVGKHIRGSTGTYKVVKHIASGGMGHIYEAANGSSQNVVVKFPATKMPDGSPMSPGYHAQVVEKLKVESQVLKNFSQARPPSIVRYVDESADPHDFFLVIEKIHGRTITKMVPSSGLLEKDVIRYSLDVLAGLEFMHKHNTIYRDMKPDNIMLTDSKKCILIDFGAAKQGVIQTSPGRDGNNATGLQSAGWTCPEQASGRASAECDLYALGRVMFFMASGFKPFRFTDHAGRMQKKLQQLKPRMNAGLSTLIDEMIDPQHRVAHTASGISARLRSLQGAGSAAAPAAVRQVVQQQPRPRAGAFTAGSGAEARIVLQGVEYKISNNPGGTLIGRIHDEMYCLKKKEGCNMDAEGRNIFIGWNCPKGCRCSYNPAHVIDKHHMKIWRDQNGNMCLVNNDQFRRSAINRNGRWQPVIHHKKYILYDRDEIALLYNEKKGPFVNFTFYMV